MAVRICSPSAFRPSTRSRNASRLAYGPSGKGEREKAASYSKTAKEFAQRWIKEAKDGDHFRLAFDRPGTWSQKYNLVWDKILGLGLFPEDVLRTEMDFYKKKQNVYGLPLDNRKEYTKLDWIVWTASLTQNRSDFEALIATNLTGVYRSLRAEALSMQRAGGGAIVNISSIAGDLTHRWMSAYCASKAGVNMLTRCAADDLGEHGIRVNAVMPSLVPTELTGMMVGNQAVVDEPSLVNTDPENAGWFFKLTLSDDHQINDLMSEEQYKAYCESL